MKPAAIARACAVIVVMSSACTAERDSPVPPPGPPTPPAPPAPPDAPPAPGTNAQPPLGKYRLVLDFSITGCVEHVGGRGIGGGVCKKEATEVYAKGRVIDVDTFFWDDATKTWGAKVEVFGQHRVIPLQNIEHVP